MGHTSRKHASLEHTKEEARGQQAGIVLYQALHHGGESKQEHVDREPDVGLELFEQHVAGNLKETVGYKEDD